MSWNEAAFGRDDGIICDATHSAAGFAHAPCGAKTWVIDDDGRGYISYECERGHHFAVQEDFEEEHDINCDCEDCSDNAMWDAIRDEEMYGNLITRE